MAADRTASRSLTPSGSAFLDVVRFGAALVVFLGHLPALIPSFGRLVHLAHIAVCLFFVLSGFIIRMVVVRRAPTLKEFLIDRASRIYSVAIPALLLAVICAAISTWVNPSGRNITPELTKWSHVPLQIFTNLTFSAEWWGYETVPIFNSPFWSLSFECVYYVLFALLFFRWRTRSGKLILALLLVLSGPAIVFLFPTWLLGVLLYDAYVWLSPRPRSWLLTTLGTLGLLCVGWILRHPFGDLLTATDALHRTAWLQSLFSASFRNRFGGAKGELPWLSRASSSYYLAGIYASAGMLWGLLTLDRFCPDLPAHYAHKIRWVAEGTFSLYLLHLPLVLLAVSLSGGHPRFPGLIAAFICAICIVASRPLDRLKVAMREALHGTRLPGVGASFGKRVPGST